MLICCHVETVFCHGFVNAADGRKMSKSYNNTINPIEVSVARLSVSKSILFCCICNSCCVFYSQILDKYSADTVRYYSIMATTFGADLNFSEASLVLMHNAELADTLGNLVHRGINLCLKFCGGQIPDVLHDAAFPLPFDFLQLGSRYQGGFVTLRHPLGHLPRHGGRARHQQIPHFR